MKFDRAKFNEWEHKNHIPAQVKRIVNAVLVAEGYYEPFPPIDESCGDLTKKSFKCLLDLNIFCNFANDKGMYEMPCLRFIAPCE